MNYINEQTMAAAMASDSAYVGLAVDLFLEAIDERAGAHDAESLAMEKARRLNDRAVSEQVQLQVARLGASIRRYVPPHSGPA